MLLQHDHFALSNFEGTLDFLLCLLQKEEIEISDVPLQEIMHQFLFKLAEIESGQLERGAEFVGVASYLVWLKSKMLLPQEPHSLNLEEALFEDPHFEIIHHLVDYCHFKRAAKELSVEQEKQQKSYFRGTESLEWKKPLGIDHLSLEDLSLLFREILKRREQCPPPIEEETWRVSDKIFFIRMKIKQESVIPFNDLFESSKSRLECIVIFLAILELIKMGEIIIPPLADHSTTLTLKKR